MSVFVSIIQVRTCDPPLAGMSGTVFADDARRQFDGLNSLWELWTRVLRMATECGL